MTNLSLLKLLLRNFNYIKKWGVIVFYYKKTLKPLQNKASKSKR